MRHRTLILAALLAATALATTALPPPAYAGGPPIGEDLRSYLQPRTLLILGVGGAATVWAHQIEDPHDQAETFSQGGLDVIGDIGNVYGSPFTQAALAGTVWGVGAIRDDEGFSQAGYEMVRALAYTYGAVGVLKYATDRTRPNGEKYSFPSGHAAGSFATAPILMKRFGWRAGVPAYLLSVAACMGRLKDEKHYLSDVVFGATLGLSVGVAVSGHDPVPAAVSLSPVPGGAAVSMRF